MLYKAHMVTTASIVSIYTAASHQNIIDSACMIGLASIGALLPDIDEPKSKIGRKFPSISKLVNKGGHRTYTHTLWAVLLFLAIYILIPIPFLQFIILWLGVGYTLHLLEDSFSLQGVLWLYPLTQWATNKKTGRPYKRGHHKYWLYYRTGGAGEKVITMIAWLILLICIGIILNHQFLHYEIAPIEIKKTTPV